MFFFFFFKVTSFPEWYNIVYDGDEAVYTMYISSLGHWFDYGWPWDTGVKLLFIWHYLISVTDI
jgi:hypothetical protein